MTIYENNIDRSNYLVIYYFVSQTDENEIKQLAESVARNFSKEYGENSEITEVRVIGEKMKAFWVYAYSNEELSELPMTYENTSKGMTVIKNVGEWAWYGRK